MELVSVTVPKDFSAAVGDLGTTTTYCFPPSVVHLKTVFGASVDFMTLLYSRAEKC